MRQGVQGVEVESGRVIAVFGPRGVGKTTLLRVIHEEATTRSGIISVSDVFEDQHLGALEAEVERHRKHGSEVIFLEGLPATPDHVQWLYDSRFVTPAGGAVARMSRNAVVDLRFQEALPAIESAIQALSLPYTVVHADDPTVAAEQLFFLAQMR
jgi:Fe-S cluster assembly ATPase SufC